MTKEEILKMPAGKEMDELIGRLVFRCHWTVNDKGSWGWAMSERRDGRPGKKIVGSTLRGWNHKWVDDYMPHFPSLYRTLGM